MKLVIEVEQVGEMMIAVLTHGTRRHERILDDAAEATLLALTDWIEAAKPPAPPPKRATKVGQGMPLSERLRMLGELRDRDGSATPKAVSEHQGISLSNAHNLLHKAHYMGVTKPYERHGHVVRGRYEHADAKGAAE